MQTLEILYLAALAVNLVLWPALAYKLYMKKKRKPESEGSEE